MLGWLEDPTPSPDPYRYPPAPGHFHPQGQRHPQGLPEPAEGHAPSGCLRHRGRGG